MPRRGARLPAAQLSSHPVSVARRAVEHAMRGHERAVHRAGGADRSAVWRALKRLQRVPAFQAGSAAARSEAMAHTRAAVMNRRWAEHRSAQWVLDHPEDYEDEDEDEVEVEVLADQAADHEPAANPAEGGAAVETAVPAVVAPVVVVAVAEAAPAGSTSASGAAPAPSLLALLPPRSQGDEGDE
ncbi:MAG: hypothetical protein M1826_007312 [Phylliscum demangeonii]|nr:MAG: hypothetical protein M1826_007312 [Phylliscum demangeonii]